MSSYANGKKAFGFCDRTGFRYPLRDLVPQIEDGRPNGLLVGRDVLDKDNPQLQLGRIRTTDPQALRNPRPDRDLNESRGLSAFDPVGGGNTALGSRTVGLDMFGQVGRVEVQISESDSTASITGSSATGSIGDVSVEIGSSDANVSVTGLAASSAIGTIVPISDTFAVTVANPGSGNKYYIDGVPQATVNLTEGNTYRFDQSDSSNGSPTHPLRFSTTSDGTWGGGSEYTTGVVTVGTPGTAGAYTQITVAASAPTLYYYCSNHSGMGGQANTPS